MAKNRALGGVLHNFLGTFISRNSDLDGYWLFGLLIRDIQHLKIDLLSHTSVASGSAAVRTADLLGKKKFAEQLEKSGIAISSVDKAFLEITALPTRQESVVNGCPCFGYNVLFLAHVIAGSGRAYRSEVTLFVAPNDPKLEHRSTRSQSDTPGWFTRIFQSWNHR